VTDPPRRRGLALALGLLGAPALLLAQKPAPRPVLDTLAGVLDSNGRVVVRTATPPPVTVDAA